MVVVVVLFGLVVNEEIFLGKWLIMVLLCWWCVMYCIGVLDV